MSNKAIKKLGFWSIVLLGVNSIIGTGIFLTPGSVIKQAGTLAPLAYLLAGVFAVVLAMVFANAAKYVKTNGAAYAYTTAAFGDNVGIYVGITRSISAGIAWGVMATAVTKTLFEIFLKDQVVNNPYHNYFYLGGLLLLFAILLVINFAGTRIVEIASNVSTVGKLAALGLFVVAGIIIVVFYHVNNYSQAGNEGVYSASAMSLFGFFDLGKNDWTGLIVATISALYAFTGFESIANAAEDMEEPEKNLPRAIPITIGIVAVAYVSVIVVGMLLGPEQIATSNDTVKLAAVISNDVLKMIIVLGAVVSMIGINIAASFSSPRIFVALADNGVLPKVVSKQTKLGVPMISFFITALLALAFPIALKFDMSSLTGLSVIVRFIQFILVPIAVIVMARSGAEKWKDIKRNVLTDYILPVIAVIASVFLAIMYNYKAILYNGGLAENGMNTLSIGALVLLFIVVPICAYTYFYKVGKKRRDSEAK